MDRRGFESRLHNPPIWMMPVLIPLSVVYRFAVFSNQILHRLGLLKTRKLPRPVICVGNISVGGSGKTPLVIWLTGQLAARGFRTAVLTRGYGGEKGTGKGSEVIRGAGRSGGIFPGDEPLMISSRHPDVPVYVSPDRFGSGMRALKEEELDLFVMDDGFQHFALERDLDIVTVDGRRRFGNGRLMPAGFLREPLSRLIQADIVVVTKSPEVDKDFHDYLGCLTHAPVCWSDFRPTQIVRLKDGAVLDNNSLAEENFLLFSGIADPISFEETVGGLPVNIAEKIRYPDHHPFGDKEIREINELALKEGATALLTTEKDAFRWADLSSSLPCHVLRMDPVFLLGEEILLEKVLSLVER